VASGCPYAAGMTESVPDVEPVTREPGRPIDPTFVALATGLVACVAVIIGGLVLALQKVVVECPDGQYFPEGTSDYHCFSHPQAALGISVLAAGIALAALIVLVQTAISALSRTTAAR
jgi:hypothetical protein